MPPAGIDKPRAKRAISLVSFLLFFLSGGFLAVACGSQEAETPVECAAPLAISFVGDGGLHAVAADGTCFTTLHESTMSYITWSTTGRRFAGMRFPGSDMTRSGPGELYVVDLDTEETTRIAGQLPGVQAYAWSPNGRELAIVGRVAGGNDWDLDLYIASADGANLTAVGVASPVDIITAGDPISQLSWSPDGLTVAFQAGAGAAGIWTVRPSDHTFQRVATNGILPKWSPDGQQIAFVAGGLWVADASGDNAREVVPPTGARDEFSWSPDSKRLVISGRVVGEPNWLIYVLDLESSVLTRISDPSVQSSSPAWSPDGTRIAFAAFTPGWVQEGSAPYQLWITDPLGETRVRLTQIKQGVGAPQWLPWTGPQ